MTYYDENNEAIANTHDVFDSESEALLDEWIENAYRNERKAIEAPTMPPLRKEVAHIVKAVRTQGIRCISLPYISCQMRGRVKKPAIKQLWRAIETRAFAACIAGSLFVPVALVLPHTNVADAEQPQYKQYADSDHTPSHKGNHIAYSDDTFTITLHGCEENEKHHWSCEYTTPGGDTHWMYIPNYKPKHQTTEKGGR